MRKGRVNRHVVADLFFGEIADRLSRLHGLRPIDSTTVKQQILHERRLPCTAVASDRDIPDVFGPVTHKPFLLRTSHRERKGRL
jgi:hypothetical protein